MLEKIRAWITSIISIVIDFVFHGSKSITPKRKPLVAGVRRIFIADHNIRGFIFYPVDPAAVLMGNGRLKKFSAFPDGLRNVVIGKSEYYIPTDQRSLGMTICIWIFTFFCNMIPSVLLPSVRGVYWDLPMPPLTNNTEERLPLIVWSHGRGCNTHDNTFLCSQLASEVPGIVVAITHTDGTADNFQRMHAGQFSYYLHLKSSAVGDGDQYLEQLVEMREYQIRNRCEDIRVVLDYMVRDLRIDFGPVIAAGFDIGGATAVSIVSDGSPNRRKICGAISIDGMFSIEDRFKFPREVYSNPPDKPVAFVVSDDWACWNKPMMDNTNLLLEEVRARTDERTRLITVKQTNHFNFTEVMYWVPQIFVRALRFTGLLHRRGDPRKTYKRVTKWLIALVQQYTDGNYVCNNTPQDSFSS